jgi:hypothetical protein
MGKFCMTLQIIARISELQAQEHAENTSGKSPDARLIVVISKRHYNAHFELQLEP